MTNSSLLFILHQIAQKNIKFENFDLQKNSSSLCTGNFSKYPPAPFFPYYACLLTELLKIREFYVSATNAYLV